MKTKRIQKGVYIESVFGNGYVLRNDKKNAQVIISSKGTLFEDLFETVTISYKYITKIIPMYFYKVRYDNDLKGDDVVDIDSNSLSYAKKKYNQICADSTKYNVVLMKYKRTATGDEWVEDISEGE